jgi:hypothetical protein
MKKIFVPVVLAVVLLSVQNRASAITIFTATLTGSQEVPPNASTATGMGTFVLNDAQTELAFTVTYAGLTGGNFSAAHFHAPAPPGMNAGVARGLANPAETGAPATSGVMSGIWKDTDAAALTATRVSQLFAGTTYFNIHNATFPGGEIRGQILVTPEPTTVTLLLVGAAGLAAVWLRKRRAK